MILVINGTNRVGNISQIFSRYYYEALREYSNEVKLLEMGDLPLAFLNNHMFSEDGRSSEITRLQDELIIPSDKLFFILPEYNGGVPGVLKLFIDACSTYEREASFKGKKVGMMGIAAGRAGNLRGMDHLTGVMNYLGSIVMPDRLPVSSVGSLVKDGILIDESTKKTINAHADSFAKF